MSWDRFKEYYLEVPSIGFSMDISRVEFPSNFFESMRSKMDKAFSDMDALEGGAISNPDEGRMVGHYWLRNSDLAPTAELKKDIDSALAQIEGFSKKVHSGAVQGESGPFKNLLVIGIGGSALGPQFVSQALGSAKSDKLKVFFFDNTDPDGMSQVMENLDGELGQTISVVISKSGSTPETRNGMVEAKAAYEKAGLNFGKHAVAVTGRGSQLDKVAIEDGWLDRFPMWDWVGGRTSELCAVGLLPAALQGLDIQGMLKGAAAMDVVTRSKKVSDNPSALLALMWHYCTNGKGEKDMVVLPYKDRLMLFSRYLQQLVMESLGKELDLEGKVVNQGIAVYGNKGSTDQHAYVQQLREGVNNFFAIFVEVLEDGKLVANEVEPGFTSGDYLKGFFLGTREALSGNKRESITLTVDKVTPFSVGLLIALFERAVGFYASLVGINAYHQPGVEAGKKAAASILEIQKKIAQFLNQNKGNTYTADEVAVGIKMGDQAEIVFKLLENFSVNRPNQFIKTCQTPFYLSKYAFK
jgi:glucose-6-phosphate isomerase